jgi:hypothetical protein
VQRPRLALLPGLACAVALYALGCAGWAAWDQDVTYDEPFHLGWTERLLASRQDERASQYRYNSKTPIMVPNVLARQAARGTGVSDPRWLLFAARVPTLLWLPALFAGAFALGRRLGGPQAGWLAVLACGLDPNLAAHASLATVDAASAATTLLVLLAGLRCAEQPGASRGAALGAAVGLALTAKFSALLLLPGLLGLALVRPLAPATARSRTLAVLGAVASACLLICASYLFVRVGHRLDSQVWRSAPLRSVAAAAPALRSPLPLAFLTGIDASLADERLDWNVYLLGQRYRGGVPWYFAVVAALKTPLALLLPTLLGVWLVPRTREALFVAFNLALQLGYFSLLFRGQIGYRYVLMAIAPVYVLAAAGLARRAWPRPAGWALLAGALLEGLPYLGNPLAFTNAAVQPKATVYRLMADSNLDWGQDRDRIQRYLAQARASNTQLDPLHILPGHVTLSVNVLAGIWDFEQHRFAREQLTPDGHYGFTHVFFQITPEQFDRFLGEARRLLPADQPLCPDDLPWEPLGAGRRRYFDIPDPPDPESRYLLCVETRRGVDLALKAVKGAVHYGPLREGTCTTQTVVDGQSSWWRLEPGRHGLCADEIQNRRSWLPSAFQGVLVARRHGARVAVRKLPRQALPTRPEQALP